MSDAWMPGAGYLRTAADGGQLKGGAPRAVWQALGADPRMVSARSAAQRLEQLGRPCHLVWNPLCGEIVQLVPIVRAARSLGCPEGLEQPAPGVMRWTLPSGRTHTTTPTEYEVLVPRQPSAKY